MNIPVLSSEQIEMFFLVFLRVTTIIAMIPVLGDRTVPFKIKGSLSLFVAFLVFPFVQFNAPLSENLFSMAFRMAGEILIGVMLGFASRLIFAGIQLAGQLIGFQMGFSIVNIIDPVSSDQVSIIAEFQYLVAALLFLATSAHHIFLAAIVESYKVLPIYDFQFTGALMQALIALSGNMFVIAAKISAPLIAALLLTNVGLGLIARTVPQINIFIVGFPLQIAVGLIGVGLTLPIFLNIVGRFFNNLEGEVSLLLRLM